MSFEIKYKDAMGRVGTLQTPHGKVRTPALMPVVHPGRQVLDVKKYGAEIVITNAYIIYKNEDLRIKALERGVHKLINFPGTVVTDSGSFQLSEYGDIQVTNQEIVEFQEAIGTDIGTSLDIPTPPYVGKERAERELKLTLKRAEEALKARNKLMLNSVVQGSTYPDLRARCAHDLGKMGFDVYPIGAVVPLMESYQYSALLEVVMASVINLPDSKPRHLMGAGHPMVFALAVAMGCDLFDSAAYVLYAMEDRLLMPNGTYKLENLNEMPCTCPVCDSYTPGDLKEMKNEERMRLLSQHNLHVSFAEIRTIRQAIFEGSLWELVEQRCRAHPYLLDAVRNLKKYIPTIEKYDPPFKKSAFFYSGPESLNRPEVHRHLKRLERIPQKRRLLMIPPCEKPYSKNLPQNMGKFYFKKNSPLNNQKFYSNKNDNKSDDSKDNKPDNSKKSSKDLQVVVADVPFAIIPLEIEETYPLSQNESPRIYDEDARKFVGNIIKNYIKNFEDAIVSKDVVETFDLDFATDYIDDGSIDDGSLEIDVDDEDRIRYISDYQFGTGSGQALFKGDVEIVKSKKTGKIRHIYSGENLIATLRASDGVFVLGRKGARRLHQHLPYPQNRVVVNEDAEPFAVEGKSIFAKFIIDCDINIRANEEVLIVNDKDDLLAFGKSILCGPEIINFNIGQAVKTRKGGF